MRAGSLFSGIGAPECAAPHLDWRWCAEIDPFASAVHARRFPHIPNLGDILEVDWHAVEPVDLVVAGPPCQDHSVAGQRAGMGGSRGNLSLVYCDILDAVDPLWSLTENVPGWLSLADNAFGEFLGRLVGAGAALVPAAGQRWTDAGVVAGPRRSAAWRTLDAQYFGVAQRRRRVFVLAQRGAGADTCAAALFPVVQSMQRDFAPRRDAREGTANCLGERPDRGGTNSEGQRLIPTMGARGGERDRDFFASLVAPALPARKTAGGGMGTDFDCDGGLVAHTLRADGFDAGEDGTGRGTPLVAMSLNARGGTGRSDGESETFVVIQNATRGQDQNGLGIGGDIVTPGMTVRRLTPTECERLQGFPDDHTAISYRNKPAADGPRYRALGNSMAVPCLKWLLSRIIHNNKT